MKTLIAFIGATFFSLYAHADTVTIDFEEWGDYTIISSFTSKGYQFESDGASTVIHSHNIILPGYGNDYAWSNLGSDSVGAIITKENGGAFSLQQFDAASYEIDDNNVYSDFLAIGTRASDGSQVSFVFDANQGLTTYSPSNFGLLTSLAFYTPAKINNIAAGFHLDNMVLTAVPIPASVWLFSSALIGLFGFMRNETSRSRANE